MSFQQGLKFSSFVEFREYIPMHERIMVDALRDTIKQILPATCIEKLAYNVPFYYGKKRISFIWPASVPCGGFKTGVMLGFCQGYKLADRDRYLVHGTNKRFYYRIFQSVDEIEFDKVITLLEEAVKLDRGAVKLQP